MADALFHLVVYVRTHPGVSQQELASHFKVSTRTIRSRVRRLNESLAGIASVDLSPKAGYFVHVIDSEALSSWAIRRAQLYGASITSAERARRMVTDLLSRNDCVTLDSLAQILYVSRATVSADLRLVERMLAVHDLKLERKSHRGIRVTGPEPNRRAALATIVVDTFQASEAKLSQPDEEEQDGPHGAAEARGDENAIVSVLGDEAISSAPFIAECLDRVFTTEGISISSIIYQNLLVHISIAVMRMREGSYVPMEASNLNRIKRSDEYVLARAISQAIEQAFHLEFPEEETAYITIHLAGKKVLAEFSDDSSPLSIPDKVWNVVDDMLSLINQTFHVDFSDDLELHMNLARHVGPLAVRLQYHLGGNNPLLADTKRRFPLAWAMALESSSVLLEAYGEKLSDDETGFIALLFALALERRHTHHSKKNVLIVCSTGIGSARLLELRIRQRFGESIAVVRHCNVAGIDKVDFRDIDYVFTTVPIGRPLPVPVREVRTFLAPGDFEDLERLLSSRGSIASASGAFDQALFFPHLAFSQKEDVLDFLCARMAERVPVDDDFHDLVLRREDLAVTSFGNGVAMPHPMRPTSHDVHVCVGILDAPILWDGFGHMVQAVFLISLPREGEGTGALFSVLAELFVSEDDMGRLITDQTWQTLSVLLGQHGIDVHANWVTKTGERG
ncbi:MAG: BglG family transcription antiterminator [Olsenella profusa]